MSEKKKGLLSQEISLENIKALFSKKSKDSFDTDDDTTAKKTYRDPRFDSFEATQPSVNLLPQKVIDEVEGYHTSRKMMVIAAGVVILFGGLYGSGVVVNVLADSKSNSLEEESRALMAQANSLTPYYNYGESLKQKRQELFTNTQGEISYQAISRDFNTIASSAGVSVSSLSFTSSTANADSGEPGADGAAPDSLAANPTTSGAAGADVACPKPDPFTDVTGEGCVSFTVSGGKDQIIRFYEAAENSGKFVNMYIPQPLIGSDEGEDQGIVGTVEYVDSYLSENNYELNEQIADGVAEAATAIPKEGE